MKVIGLWGEQRRGCRTSMRWAAPSIVVFAFAAAVVPRVHGQAGTPAAVAAQLQQAQADLRKNDGPGAAELFRAVLKVDPTNVEAHANLGVMAFFRGDCPAAVPELESAVQSAPSLTKPKALIALCEKRMGKPSAKTDIESSFAELQDAKLRVQVGIELADLYYQEGDLTRTAAVLHTLSDLSPDNVDILFFEQRVYSELADGTLNKLALLAPGSARMEQLIAERLINAGDLKDAIVHYRKALQINPHLPGMHFELAESLVESTPNDQAAQKEASGELELAVKVDGDSAKIEALRGRIAAAQSNQDAAQADYRRALELSPDDAQAEVGLAELLQEQGNMEEAARYLHRAITSDPMNAEAHYRLSQVDGHLQLKEEQKKELDVFLEIRSSKDKIKGLYREMDPAAEAAHDRAQEKSKP